jgi:hypothetical protein
MRLMRRPVAFDRAYGRFGLLLGSLPPAAIFYRMFGYGFGAGAWDEPGVVAICCAMNVVCALAGWRMGRVAGRLVVLRGFRSLVDTLAVSIMAGLLWAVVTGAAGGAIFFGVGLYFGAACALAVALPAFPVFALLHRALSRGGMIDARHLRPLAWGVAATAAAVILGL